jgi:hypothetical protein
MNFVQQMGQTTTKRFTLKDPDTVSADDGSTGTWTMIYDEAFEVAVNDMVYLAFSKFEFVNGPDGKTNVSHCDQTEVGWYHNAARDQWGCYVGRKLGVDSDAARDMDMANMNADLNRASSGPSDVDTSAAQMKDQMNADMQRVSEDNKPDVSEPVPEKPKKRHELGMVEFHNLDPVNG